MKRLFLLIGIMTIELVWATPSITSVTVQPHTPWDGKVDIEYTASGNIFSRAYLNGDVATIKVTAIYEGREYVASSLEGDVSIVDGIHRVIWNVSEDGLPECMEGVVFKVSCIGTPAKYCIIDLSSGSASSGYPLTYLKDDIEDGFNTDKFKTTKLVLKRIEPGVFVMGENQDDQTHRVTLTKPFYIGIFELTQKQWSLVMGSIPARFEGDMLPIEQVSYNDIRGSSNGAKWPASSAVDSSSFIGRLQARTSLKFDLPTEAQWEYACRAGTSTIYSNGNVAEADCMWYSKNSDNKTHKVGLKSPNNWGLYDMSGNVCEWCLDWHGDLTYGDDPKGATTGVSREVRGGSWKYEDKCGSGVRFMINPRNAYGDLGARISWTPERIYETDGVICSDVTDKIDVNIKPWVQLSVEEISEWVAYDLAERFATKHNITAKGYRDLFKDNFSYDYVAAFESKTGKVSLDGSKLRVWHDYIAGTDPLDINSKFTAEIMVGEDGKPVIEWSPNLGEERVYKILGSTDLKTWAEVSKGEEANYNFFKVSVEMK